MLTKAFITMPLRNLLFDIRGDIKRESRGEYINKYKDHQP
jgi:hypothetical protein